MAGAGNENGMILFLLGVIIGLVSAVIFFVAGIWVKPRIERRLNQVVSQMSERGKIIEPENDELESWLSELKHDSMPEVPEAKKEG